MIDRKKKQNRRRGIGVLFLLILAAGIFGTESGRQIEAKQVVRVGYFLLSGFQDYDEEGRMTGYNVDYLNKLTEYTDWEYEYVPLNSWLEAVSALEQGEIDIIAPAQRTKEREEKFLFSEYSIGTEYGGMMALSSNDELQYEDFEAYNGIRVGCLDSSVLKKQFHEYAEKQGFEPEVIYCDTEIEMYYKLFNRQLDALIINYAESSEKIKLLARFAPSPYYYMMNKNNEELAEELNLALEKLQGEYPDFASELMNTYYPDLYNIPYTRQEMEYVEAAPVFRVGVMMREPLSYLDKNGESIGILIDLLDLIQEKSGIAFEYVPLAKEKITYEYIRENNLDLIMGVENTKVNRNLADMSLTKPFFTSQKVMVGKSGIQFSPEEAFKVAVYTGSVTLEKTLAAKYPKFEMVNYESTDQCLEAVLKGEADVLLQSQYAVEKLLAKPKYDQLVTIPETGLKEELCLAAVLYPDSKGVMDPVLSDDRLINILNKAIQKISDEEMNNIIISYTAGIPYQVTVSDFLYRFRVALVIILLLLVIGIVLAVTAWRLHNKNINIIKKNEQMLSGIANNINGGVVMLAMDTGFKIQYANSGFAKMVGIERDYEKTLFSENYTDYICQEDVPRLNEMLQRTLKSGGGMELELGIQRVDGSSIPALFHGTVALEDGKPVLYCVVMDISVQKKMMQEIEEERERYAMIIEQTDDIVFDINLEEETIITSRRFEEVFQRSITSPAGWAEESRDSIHEEDRERFGEAVLKIQTDSNRETLRIRLKKADGTCLWCDLIMGAVRRKGKLVRIVGKITDVDAQVREHQELQEKSMKDGLTGLLKKEAFQEAVEKILKKNTGKKSGALLFLDMDNFKRLNDTLGHQEGDEALCHIADMLRYIFGRVGILGRFGGDEFFIFAQDIQRNRLVKLAQRLKKQFPKNFGEEEKGEVEINVSMGIAWSEKSTEDYDTLLSQADTALYKVKREGKGHYLFYTESMEAMDSR